MDAFAATRFALGLAFLGVAAASDLRTRRVPDRLWIALGTIGLAVLGGELMLRAAAWPSWSFAGSAALLFAAVFFGEPLMGEEGFRLRPLRILLFLAAAILFFVPLALPGLPALGPTDLQLATMPVMLVVYQGFYHLRLLHGGADAKALIALTLLVPAHPSADPFPLLRADPLLETLVRVLFPFSFVVWVNAALVSLAVPVGLFLFNAVRRDLAWPQMFLGYRAPLGRLPAHAWLMEKITDRGEHVLVLFPRRVDDRSAEVGRLRAAGIERVWVTPKTPFMIPLAVGFALSFLAGNLLLGLFGVRR